MFRFPLSLLTLLAWLLFPQFGYTATTVTADSLEIDSTALPAKTITVFFRVDDVFMLESEFLPQEIDSFLAVADHYEARVMLATIPNRLRQLPNQDNRMANQLRAFHARGHQVIQHGFDHRCTFTQSTSWEFHNPDVETGHTDASLIALLSEGKALLEAAIGAEISTYVGPGYDNDYVVRDHEYLYRNDVGYTVLTDQNTSAMYQKDGKTYFFSLSDYAWALSESNYNEKLEEVKRSFNQAVLEGRSHWGILFHDHFTRYAWGNGITVRWFDELLNWLTTHPDIEVEFSNIDEWVREQGLR